MIHKGSRQKKTYILSGHVGLGGGGGGGGGNPKKFWLQFICAIIAFQIQTYPHS